MQFNYYFLKQLSSELKGTLSGYKLVSCFSQNKNEIIFGFEGESQTTFIKAILDGEVSLLSFPSEFARARRNSVNLFDDLLNKTVTDIYQFENERCFSIDFSDHYRLLFKLHGKMSNILLFKGKHLVTLFKSNLENDLNININELDRPINQSDETIQSHDFELKSIFPTFDKIIYRQLEEFSSTNVSSIEKLPILKALIKRLNAPKYYIYDKPDGIPRFSLFAPDSPTPYETFLNPIEACNKFAQRFLSTYHFRKEQQKQLSKVTQEIKKAKNYLSKTNEKLIQIETRRKYEEIANILMANLHVERVPKSTRIKLFDFYTNEEIEIKINSKLSLQHNAEAYYRKSKNQAIEIEKLKSNLSIKSQLLERLEKRKNDIVSSSDSKNLRSLTHTSGAQRKTASKVPSLFYKYNIDGYEVLIGKNAKNNDLLTTRHANKNDLWLHARDVSGSHVVIKNKGDDKYPMTLIEKVAQLAAWHSKRQSDTLCPVIYTLKKYVTKPKGAPPGLAKLMREEVILVEPKRSVS